MKNIVFILLFLGVYLFSNANSKTYVNSSSICFIDNSIVVEIDKELFVTNSIHSDSYGVYVLSIWPFTPFTCDNCGAWNPSYRTTCKRCGFHRKD